MIYFFEINELKKVKQSNRLKRTDSNGFNVS